MVNDFLTTDALGVWHELELALAGKNGFGGDVAEIYAYRLVPRRIMDKADPSFITGATEVEEQGAKEELACVAGANMTVLLRRFVELHEDVVILIEERGGFRPIAPTEEFPPFDWRVHLRVEEARSPVVALSTKELREALKHVAENSGTLVSMLDELTAHRSKGRLKAEAREPADTADLPPDGTTGLYLDRPFDVEDLAWVTTAWGAYLSRDGHGASSRPAQLMLVFQAIRRDDRATQEFLRVMNTIVLPLCRRLRLKEQPNLRNLGAAE